MEIVATVAGGILVVVLIREVFRTLFRPEGRGSIGSAVQRRVWAATRAAAGRRPQRMASAGPVAVASVIITWVLIAIAAWSLIYWAALGGEITSTADDADGDPDRAIEAIYLSVVTLSTLGYGDLVPQGGWMRLAAPIQALVGFGLLTASVTWLLSLYPAIGRQRTLARRLRTFDPMGERSDLADPSALTAVMDELASATVEIASDLNHFPVTYFFETRDRRESLATSLPLLFRIAADGSADSDAAVRRAARVLSGALDEVAEVIASRALGHPEIDTQDVVTKLVEERSPPTID